MKIAMRRTYPAVSADAVARLEAVLGTELPVDYRLFLQDQNGGLPEKYLFVTDDDEVAVRFFGVDLGEDAEYDDLRWNAAMFKGRIPSSMLAIGSDPGGNLILLGISDEAAGRVYYWDHSREEESESNTRELAVSLDAFLQRLVKDPGEP